MTLEQKMNEKFAPQGTNIREHLETEFGVRLLTHKDASGKITSIKVPHEPDLPEHVRQALAQIRELKKYTTATGFKTTRSQNDILQKLDGSDLANALLILNYGR